MISIIIPTLNEEKIIAETLQALKKDFTLPHEIIISDGKSTDKTVEIAKKYADSVVEYTDAKRQTIAQGRNDGARVAHGEFLVFLDADCFIKHQDIFFTRALEYFNNPQVVCLTANLKVLPEFETVADALIFSLANLSYRIINNVFHRGASPGEFQMIRTETFRELKGFNETLVTGEDVDMFYRLSQHGTTIFASDLTVFHTGRRAHKIGWPRLLSDWFLSTVSIALQGKSIHKEWKEIR